LVDNVVVLPADTSLGQGPGPNQESARVPKQVHRQRANDTLDTAAHERPKRVMQGSRSATSRCCVDARVQLPSHPAARRRSGPTWGAIRYLGGVILAGGTRKVNAMTWCFTCLDDRRILTGDHNTGITRLECGHYTTHHGSVEGLKALPVRAHGPARGNRVARQPELPEVVAVRDWSARCSTGRA
jgi:hypothetical protein